MKQPAVYILTNKRNGTLYIGVTSDMSRRLEEHRKGIRSGFASRYGCAIFVYYEPCSHMKAVIAREKQLKGWRRAWKIALIEKENPQWKDLFTKSWSYNPAEGLTKEPSYLAAPGS